MGNTNPLIIGLTGSFGSGYSETADYLKTKGFSKFSLTNIIRDEAKRIGVQSPKRKELQDIGDKLRRGDESKRDYDLSYLARETIKKFGKGQEKIVVNSIKNHGEVYKFRKEYTKFYLFNIDAEEHVRYERVKKQYSSIDAFREDDERDSGENQPEYGQQVRKCAGLSDIVINHNTTQQELQAKLDYYLKLIENPKSFTPQEQEIGMAKAFKESFKSRCLKRQVGATIMKNGKEIISGYNDVPELIAPCNALGECIREYYMNPDCSNCGKPIDKNFQKLSLTVKECSRCNTPIPKDWIKMMEKHLDLCRALHAEERAILESAKQKIDLEGATIYVTLHPCLMCAKKIIQMGIEKVYYVDPYPYGEATKMLAQANVKAEKFEGIMGPAFDRLYSN